MGLSKGKTKSNSATTSNATSTQTPVVPGYIQQPYQNYYSQVSALQNNGGPGAAVGPTANQQAAFTGASQLGGGNVGVTQGMDATRGLLGYTPSSVAAGQLRDTDLSPYMNPYTNEVIANSLADLERQRAKSISLGQGAATQANAFGGSRHGVADSLTNEAAIREAGSLSSSLRNQGFMNAQNAAMGDIDRRFSADTFNSQQGLAGANFRLGAANQLAQQGLAGDESQRANLGLMADLGQTERDIAMSNDPQTRQMQFLAQLSALLAAGNPELFTGQTGTQNGTSKTWNEANNGGILGSLMNGLGGMGISIGGGGGGDKK